ncbi:hypothetical protein EXS57_02880 [Candidatus Kaiserbacteria bacterium]|nr:hypothetical protein [Candidatus Kaiserbacteria bacterium]
MVLHTVAGWDFLIVPEIVLRFHLKAKSSWYTTVMRRKATVLQRYAKILKGYIKNLQPYLKVLRAMPREKFMLIGTALLVGIGIPVFFITQNISSSITITDVPSTVVSIPFTTLTQGTQSAVARRVNYVLTSPTELSELWRAIGAPGKPPKVDFKTHAVIAVFAGSQSSASITVAKIEDASTRRVSIAITEPDDGCAEIQSAMLPYEIVAVSRTSLPLTHEDLSTTTSCPK